MNTTPGIFIDHSTGREYIALSEAATRLKWHPLSLYDDIKDSGVEIVTISGCKCIAADDLEKIQGATK